MPLILNEILEKLIHQHDVLDLVDYLGLTEEDVVMAFKERIEDNIEFFESLVE